MGEGKWIPDVKPSTPVAKAARKTFEMRADRIRECLAPALDALNADPEPVHQLRVGLRRATVALDLFADCVPAKVYRQARRTLRDLRRAAGQARDWDVFLLTLRPRARGGTRFLRAYVHGQRMAAQALLTGAAGRFSERFAKRWDKLLGALTAPSLRTTLLGLARDSLTELLSELHEAIGVEPPDLEHLHRVRILGKRLRYSMEVFAPCFGESFREVLYPRVEEMQEILGTLNDSRIAGLRLGELAEHLRAMSPTEWRQAKGEIAAWSAFHHRRLERQRRLFLKWLRHWQASKTKDEFHALLELAEAGQR